MLNDLAQTIRDINKHNGWNVMCRDDWQDSYRVPAVLALIHSEVSEALEDFRSDNYTHFKEEVADILIRTLDLAAGMGIDMDAEVKAKLEKNKTRGFRHGGKRV